MQLLLVNYEYPTTTPNCGGGGEVTRLLRRGLERRGHTVRVCCDGGDDAEDPALRGPERGHYSTFPFRAREHLRELASWADVVHGHFSIPSSLLLPRVCGETPYLVSVMGADIHDPTRFGTVRPAADIVNRYVLSRAEAVVAPSTDMATRVQRRYGIDAETIHYGIDTSTWDWHRRADPVHIVTVGRLVERKNLRTAIRAVRDLRERGYALEYTIVGTGPLEDTLRAEFDHDWLTVAGYVDDLQAAYDAGDIFLLPSHHEAFGMVFLEALACGLPVVTSDCGGQTDIVTPSVGETARAESYGPVAGALRRVIDSYDFRQANTEGYVDSHFDVEMMVSDYERLYHGLAASRPQEVLV